MRLGKLFLTAVVAMGAMATSASAALTAFWQKNTITPAAITNDSTLANMQSWSLRITNTDGFWASAGVRATLPAGNTFYRNLNAGDFRPSIAQQTANPALTFTTYVTSPRQSPNSATTGAPAVLGGYPEGLPLSFGGPFDDIPGLFSVSYGDPSATAGPAPGNYEIARLTFPLGVIPFISNGTGGFAASQASQVVPDQTVTVPQIPEPGSLALVAAAGLLAIRRRTA